MNPRLDFQEVFGHRVNVTASAPGVVRLLGDHAEGSDGLVLSAVVARQTVIQLASRDDAGVHVVAASHAKVGMYTLGEETLSGTWLDCVQAVTRELREAGFALSGFDAIICSEVPSGGGLAASTALTVALLRALRARHGYPLDDEDLARLARRAHGGPGGVEVGIADGMTCSLARPNEVLYLDGRSLKHRSLALTDRADLVVVRAGPAAVHGALDLRGRRAECEEAARRLGLRSLRDVDAADRARIGQLPGVLAARVRQLVDENARVRKAFMALEANEPQRAGALLLESHASLRDELGPAVAPIDAVVELAREHPDVFGARLVLTGPGNGAVLLTRPGRGRAAGEWVVAEYARRTGLEAAVLTASV